MYTADYDENRLKIDVNENGIFSGIYSWGWILNLYIINNIFLSEFE